MIVVFRVCSRGFPFSMENIPRQRSFACLSLKLGSIISALFIILYSVLVLAQCTAALCELASQTSVDNAESMLMMGMVIAVTISHSVTLFLTALMVVGVLREKLYLIRPWVVWTSIQLVVYVIMSVYWVMTNFTNHPDGNSLLMYAVGFLSLLIRFYMLMLVASYYKQLEEEQFYGERVKTLVHQDTWYNSA